MNNTVLRLLRIFEEETDNDHMLTKAEILDKLEREGYETIGEKQFYRKIEELRENGYEIEVKKGRQTRYFLRKDRLTKEEWIFLLTLILGCKDLSANEANHMIEALENMTVSYECTKYSAEYRDKAAIERSKYNQLGNFRAFLSALDEGKLVECKEVAYRDGEYELLERKTLKPLNFSSKDSRIVLEVEESGAQKQYFLSSLIDIEVKYD